MWAWAECYSQTPEGHVDKKWKDMGVFDKNIEMILRSTLESSKHKQISRPLE